tara:strand:+ start:6960 stop:8834 length:1875 start_codon:yes stop_codon:yes gene_type:complete
MNVQTIRKKFLDFYAARGHAVIPSASLVPENDPTTLFTGSGMQPLVPYLLGEKHPKGNRLVDSQKSFRAEDIEEVGDNRHTTFFEMLGNWSLGDYFKKEQLPWVYALLTEEIGLDPTKLYVTVFDGDADLGIPRDDEAIKIWEKIFTEAGISSKVAIIGSEQKGYEKGMSEGERIFTYDATKNWWSRSGVPENMPDGELGGPDSEIFYDFGTEHDTAWGAHCHPNCDCGRFIEIGNSVFMEYIKRGGTFEKLAQKNVDFGGGLERIAAASQDEADIFLATDSLRGTIETLENETALKYADHLESFRVVADHLRGAVFMIADGVRPSNTEQGYFVRRLLRRSIVKVNKVKPDLSIVTLVPQIIASYQSHYPELQSAQKEIEEQIQLEETRFKATLARGLSKLEKLLVRHTDTSEVPAEDVFEIMTSDGFPRELVQEILHEKNVRTQWHEVDALVDAHQAKSRAGAAQKFKGGLADSSEKTTQLHTTHHLLLKALQMVLGDQVKQRGSNITGERLRIDFSHGEKLTDEERAEVERIVNEKIGAHLPIVKTVMPKEAAEKLGAEQEFGQKYPDMVSVYSIGELDNAFSIEFCGGPHVENTGDIEGVFRIAKEKASSAGVRRIRGVLE